MKILVTGGAGFIGSNLVNKLAKIKRINNTTIKKIVVIDNLFLGKKEFIQPVVTSRQVDFFKQDLLDFEATLKIFKKYKFDLVFHLSANSDISYGAEYTDWDLKQGTLVTYNVLEGMRQTGIKKIVFASTSAIYGEASLMPTPEDYGPLLPISFYGASKLACEGLISALCHNYSFQALILRFANIVGRNGTHGILIDFFKKLRNDPTRLEVLGNGEQSKPYLYIDDCVEGILFGYTHSVDQINYYNLACDGATSVNKIVKMVIESLGLTDVVIEYTGGNRGWSGDVPQVKLDSKKLQKLGWVPKLSSDNAIKKATNDLLKQHI